MATIAIQNLVKNFGPVRVLRDISLDVADGEFVALLGPSGCGKTTLLRILAGLETASAGTVMIGGKDVGALPPRKRGLAMVFQNYAVFPHLTVAANVGFGLKMRGDPPDRIAAKVKAAAELLHIEAYLDRYPDRLSGGQRQRVAVARALAVEPAVLLMDEPLSNLDALLRLEMRAELKGVLKRAGTTTVYVTHDQTEAMGLADRIAVMEKGLIVQCAPPMTVYARPASLFVGGFVGSPPMNVLKLAARGGRVSAGGAQLASPVADGDVLLGFRGEDIRLVARGGLAARVNVVEPLGPHALVSATIEGQLVRLVAPPDIAAAPGADVQFEIPAGALRWFDPATGLAA